jgi:hypothetical protein
VAILLKVWRETSLKNRSILLVTSDDGWTESSDRFAKELHEAGKVAIGTNLAVRPPGGRRQSPAPGSHRTQRADFPHWARQKWIHSLARACSSG